MPVAVMVTPVTSLVTSLCSVNDWAYMKKKGFDGSVSNITSHIQCIPKINIIIFVKDVPKEATSISDSRCKRCSSNQFVVCQENRICRFCGESNYHESQNSMVTAITSTRNYNKNAAKRVAHFKNWVARLQGKERCNITPTNIDAVANMIKFYPDNMSEYDCIKLALKELKLQKYYNNVYYIMRQIMGHALVEFRKVNEARLLALFLRIQEPFSRIQNSRTNMMSYQFLIKKFCELLGYSLAYYIPLLKSRANLQRQDSIWKQVCDELGLPFYPSV